VVLFFHRVPNKEGSQMAMKKKAAPKKKAPAKKAAAKKTKKK
jgi:hypothetical protein